MPVNPETIKRWAQGVPKTVAIEDEEQVVLEDGYEEGEEVQDPIWLGETSPEEIDQGMADQFILWLADHEPEIHEALLMVGEAAAMMDVVAMENARSMLLEAEQILVPEYPELTQDQRNQIPDLLQASLMEMGNPGFESPEGTLALAHSIASARQNVDEGEDEDFEEFEEDTIEEGMLA